MNKKEYHKEHSLCPVCKGNVIETTCMAWIGDENHNSAWCHTCGWKGKEDDLIGVVKT